MGASCHGCYGGVVTGSGSTVVRDVVIRRTQASDASATPLTEREKAAVRELLNNLRRRERAPEEVSSQEAAQVTVRVPAEARLYVNSVLCPLTSETRSFNTPALERGREYFYNLRAEMVRDGETVSQTQRVTVTAGRQVSVEFNDLRPLSTVQR
jgi:uncharacterized protein (TIGR03000 family)